MPLYRQPHICRTCHALLGRLDGYIDKTLGNSIREQYSTRSIAVTASEWSHVLLKEGVKEDCFLCVRIQREALLGLDSTRSALAGSENDWTLYNMELRIPKPYYRGLLGFGIRFGTGDRTMVKFELDLIDNECELP